jgi:hypothetical protein
VKVCVTSRFSKRGIKVSDDVRKASSADRKEIRNM